VRCGVILPERLTLPEPPPDDVDDDDDDAVEPLVLLVLKTSEEEDAVLDEVGFGADPDEEDAVLDFEAPGADPDAEDAVLDVDSSCRTEGLGREKCSDLVIALSRGTAPSEGGVRPKALRIMSLMSVLIGPAAVTWSIRASPWPVRR